MKELKDWHFISVVSDIFVLDICVEYTDGCVYFYA